MMNSIQMKKIAFIILPVALLVSTSLVVTSSVSRELPIHVLLAEQLVTHCSSSNTAYQHSKSIVAWKTDTSDYQSYTDCSGFLNALLRQSYQWDKTYFRAWMGVSRPFAFHYFDAISTQNRFVAISRVDDIQPGDFIAIKYVDRSDHDNNTGHCMLVTGVPHRMIPKPVALTNTNQYEVQVIDSSKSPHGKNDTRRLDDDREYDGLGQGNFRLYADLQGKLVGYSWSSQRPKEGFDPLENPVVAGRLTIP